MTEQELASAMRTLATNLDRHRSAADDPVGCPDFGYLTLGQSLGFSTQTIHHVSHCRRCRIILKASTPLSSSAVNRWCRALLYLKTLGPHS
jgi:hypothetical protein